jgi:CubicO group peptidase (beta-lactamase class C family)
MWKRTKTMKTISSLPVAKPESVGFSAERLARIAPTLQKFIDGQMIPNAVTLVAREGKIVYCNAQGYQDREKKIPAAKDTIFRLYSNSKAIAGLATMILCEDGLLRLDDPVSKYIPAFSNPVVAVSPQEAAYTFPPSAVPTRPAKREITLRDCLCNTTGLATPERSSYGYHQLYKDLIPETGWNLMEVLDKAPPKGYLHRVSMHAKLPLNSDPGTDFLYHVGFPVIGAVIEIVTGKSLEEFYQERIFKPLGMNDTGFYLDKKKLARFSCCYTPDMTKKQCVMKMYDHAATSEKVKGSGVYGAGGDMGGLLSTVNDYARFGQMLLNGGELDGVRIIGRKSVEIMTANNMKDIVTPMLAPGYGFGLGLGVYKGASPYPAFRSPGTFGWGGAAGTTFFADPKEKIVALCFTQMFGAAMMPGNYQEEFERVVYQALM